MLHDLLRLDLGNWHPELNRPENKALAAQRVRSLKGVERGFYEILELGEIPACDSPKLPQGWIRVATDALAGHIQAKSKAERITANALAALLGPQGLGFQQISGERPRGWIIPPLREARQRWNERRFRVDWGLEDSDTQWSVVESGRTPF